jgi:hypothetical protein
MYIYVNIFFDLRAAPPIPPLLNFEFFLKMNFLREWGGEGRGGIPGVWGYEGIIIVFFFILSMQLF